MWQYVLVCAGIPLGVAVLYFSMKWLLAWMWDCIFMVPKMGRMRKRNAMQRLLERRCKNKMSFRWKRSVHFSLQISLLVPLACTLVGRFQFLSRRLK